METFLDLKGMVTINLNSEMKRELNFAIYLSHSIYNGLVEAFGIYLFRHTLRCMSEDVLNDIHGNVATIKKQGCSGMASPVTAHGFVDSTTFRYSLYFTLLIKGKWLLYFFRIARAGFKSGMVKVWLVFARVPI